MHPFTPLRPYSKIYNGIRRSARTYKLIGANLLVGLKQGCILNLVEFGCVGAEIKWDTVWFLAAQAIRIVVVVCIGKQG